MAHDQEIVGSNPGTVYWMDVSNASYYIKEKLIIKVAKWGTPKKYFKKEILKRKKSIILFC
jgi:Rad3-related DNA helicase